MCSFSVLVDIEYGGMGLDFSYTLAAIEEFGSIKSGGVALGLGMQWTIVAILGDEQYL